MKHHPGASRVPFLQLPHLLTSCDLKNLAGKSQPRGLKAEGPEQLHTAVITKGQEAKQPPDQVQHTRKRRSRKERGARHSPTSWVLAEL